MNGFLFAAVFLLLFQMAIGLFAIGMSFDPPFVWWLFVPMIVCFIAWRRTRKVFEGYLRKD